MIERKFIQQVMKEFQVKEFVAKNIGRAGLADVHLQRTPLGEKIVVVAARPGLVVGRSGANITRLTKDLKRTFKLENPQIEIEEVQSPNLDAAIVAEMIVSSLERFGPNRFKGIGHKAMQDAMNAGALGVEIRISGKIPSSRAKTWRFYQGYLKKCGDVAVSGVQRAYATAKLKSGIVGVQVSLMPPTTRLPDRITFVDLSAEQASQLAPEAPEAPEAAAPPPGPEAHPKKRKARAKAEGAGHPSIDVALAQGADEPVEGAAPPPASEQPEEEK